MTESEFQKMRDARLNDIKDEHTDVIAHVKEFFHSISIMRQKHAILMQKDETSIKDLQSYALTMDVGKGIAAYHKNMFNKTFYKYNKQRPLCQ